MSMGLREWLDSEGKTPEWLAQQLKVSVATIRHWISGRSRPRDPIHYIQISKLSGGRVDATDIIHRPTPRDRVGRPSRLTRVCS